MDRDDVPPQVPRTRTEELGEADSEAIAAALLRAWRYLEASQMYARIAAANRARTDLLARAHYARGLHLVRENARAEARLELRRALELDPALTEAQAELDAMATTRLRKL